MTRIAIAEDKAYLLAALLAELSEFSEIQVVFTARNGQECLEKLAILKSESMPEVILMDISMPKMDGIEATRHIRLVYPHIQVLMLTIWDDDEKILAAIQAGAKGYLLKEEKKHVIAEAIKEIRNGGTMMTPSVARKALDFLQKNVLFKNSTNNTHSPVADYELTSREAEIMTLLSQGCSYQHIADTTHISVNTLKKHIYNIYSKMEVHNKMQAINKFKQQ